MVDHIAWIDVTPAVSSAVLVPTSKDGRLIDSMTFVIGPYSAGPYAEGTYEVTLPVDAAMRKAIKTEYQDAFLTP